jgi:hypothetical protein
MNLIDDYQPKINNDETATMASNTSRVMSVKTRRKWLSQVALLGVVTLGMVAGVVAVGVSQEGRGRATQAAEVAFYLSADTQVVSTGEVVAVRVYMAPNGQPVTRIELNFLFSPNHFEIVDVVTTDLFSEITLPPQVNGANIALSAASPLVGVTEDGYVSTIVLRAVSTETASVPVTINQGSSFVEVYDRDGVNMLGRITPAVLQLN